MNSDLKYILKEYGCKNTDSIKERVISECKLSILQIRDALFTLGDILYENIDEQIYVATIKSGYGNMNNAIVAVRLQKDTLFVAGYAKEGIIKQNICEHAFQKLTDAALGKAIPKSGKRNWFNAHIICLSILVLTILIIRNTNTSNVDNLSHNEITDVSTEDDSKSEIALSPEEVALNAEIETVLRATKSYNDAVEDFNKYVAEYNELVAHTCIDNIEGLPNHLEELSIVSENYDDIAMVVQSNNSEEKIIADTDTVLDMTEQVKHAIAIVKQITSPTETWVKERLDSIQEISGTQAVTEEQNPDDLLGKEGGYSACIYFTTPSAIPNEVPGSSIVEKGTDAGGAVEIYKNLADAEARIAYLAGFDGTVLYSGSYAIVGTMVVRTSYKLSNEQQLYMTDLITAELTK